MIDLLNKKFPIGRLPHGSHEKAGSKIKRYSHIAWIPKDKFKIPGSFLVRNYRYKDKCGYLEHFYTLKYANLLALHRPDLYYELTKIDRRTRLWKQIKRRAALQRLLKYA